MKRFSFSLVFSLFIPFAGADPQGDTLSLPTQTIAEPTQPQTDGEKTNPKISSIPSSEPSPAPLPTSSTEPIRPQAPANEPNASNSSPSSNESAVHPSEPSADAHDKQSEEEEEESDESLGDIMDLRPAVPLKWPWYIPLLLILLVFALILLSLWMILRWEKKTKAKAKTPPLDPYTEVTRALQNLQMTDPKPFVFPMDAAVRLYLSRIFSLPAPESTTQELLYHLTICTKIPADLQITITNFLQQCDLVKFTQLPFEKSFLIPLHQQAQAIVEAAHALTQPKPTDPNSNERKSL